MFALHHDIVLLAWVISLLGSNKQAKYLSFKCGTATHDATIVDEF